MRTRSLLLAVSVLLVGETAHAQYIWPGYGGLYGGGLYGGLYGPNQYGFGGRMYGYPGGYPGYGNYSYGGFPRGFGSGYPGAFSGYNGMPVNASPSAPGASVATPGQIILPGWVASSGPRSRPTLSPAVEVPSEITAAAFSTAGRGAVATVAVKLPTPNADVWFEGVKQSKTGASREFSSPPLDPNSTYAYDVKIRWSNASGATQELTRTVRVKAGQRTVVDFTK